MQRSNERITICDSRVALLGKVGHENFIKKDDFLQEMKHMKQTFSFHKEGR